MIMDNYQSFINHNQIIIIQFANVVRSSLYTVILDSLLWDVTFCKFSAKIQSNQLHVLIAV